MSAQVDQVPASVPSISRFPFKPRVFSGGEGGRRPNSKPPINQGTQLVSLDDARGDRMRYSVSGVLALLLHAGVAAFFLVHWPHKDDEASEPAALMVNLAPAPTSPAPVLKKTPPGPQQLQAHKKPQPKTDPVKVRIKAPPVMKGPITLPKQEDKPQPTPPSPNQPPATQSTDTPTSVAPKDKDAAAPASGASSAVPRTVEESWEDAILAKLEKNKRYPGMAQMRGLEDVVYLRFTLDRKGQVLSAAIDKSKGIALLDDEVISLIHRVQPLPAPPAQVKGDTIELVVPVEFFLKQKN